MKTLEIYLKENYQRNVCDHPLRAHVGDDGKVSFYLHPLGVNGETLDFYVAGNYLVPKYVVDDMNASAAENPIPPGTLDLMASDRAKAEERSAWTRDLPTEQGAYWWWNEDEDSAPIHIEIMYSGTDGSCFAPEGQYGWTRFQPVAEMGGMWMRLHEPQTPNAQLNDPKEVKTMTEENAPVTTKNCKNPKDSMQRRVSRLHALIARAGGLLPHEKTCPACDGPIVVGDDQGRVIPLCTKQYRYDISCRDYDCVSVTGPSVAWCVRQWREEVARIKPANAKLSDAP